MILMLANPLSIIYIISLTMFNNNFFSILDGTLDQHGVDWTAYSAMLSLNAAAAAANAVNGHTFFSNSSSPSIAIQTPSLATPTVSVNSTSASSAAASVALADIMKLNGISAMNSLLPKVTRSSPDSSPSAALPLSTPASVTYNLPAVQAPLSFIPSPSTSSSTSLISTATADVHQSPPLSAVSRASAFTAVTSSSSLPSHTTTKLPPISVASANEGSGNKRLDEIATCAGAPPTPGSPYGTQQGVILNYAVVVHFICKNHASCYFYAIVGLFVFLLFIRWTNSTLAVSV